VVDLSRSHLVQRQCDSNGERRRCKPRAASHAAYGEKQNRQPKIQNARVIERDKERLSDRRYFKLIRALEKSQVSLYPGAACEDCLASPTRNPQQEHREQWHGRGEYEENFRIS